MQAKKSLINFTLSEKIDLFLTHLVENKGKSRFTAINYRRCLFYFLQYLEQIQTKPDEVSLMEIEAYTGPILSKRGLGPAGRSMAITAIRQFYLFCMRRGLLNKNPARDLEHPKKERSLPGMLSLADMEKLLFAPDLSTFIGLRDAAMMAFMFATGCRVSGLKNLNEDQLTYGGEEDPPRLYVTLKEKGGKSRKLPLNRKCELLLFSYLEHNGISEIDRSIGQTKVVFVNLKNSRVSKEEHKGENRRLTQKAIGNLLKKYGARVGIPPELLHVHAARHTMGTLLYEADMSMEDRMAWMGHERPDTMVIYPQLSESKLLKGAESANPLSKIKTPIDELMTRMFKPAYP